MANKDMPEVPGSRWRFLAHGSGETMQLENKGVFDELVVDDWFHIEQMDDRVWWLRVGDARVLVAIASNGVVTVDVERACYGPVHGKTSDTSATPP